jgi:hypothetical protein
MNMENICIYICQQSEEKGSNLFLALHSRFYTFFLENIDYYTKLSRVECERLNDI